MGLIDNIFEIIIGKYYNSITFKDIDWLLRNTLDYSLLLFAMSDSADKKYEEEEKVDAGDIELENVVNTERALVDDEDQDQDGKEKQVDQEAFTSKRL